MLLVEALSNKATKERKRFGIIMCLLAFGKKKNVLAERVWDAGDFSCLPLVEHVPINTGLGASGEDAFKIVDKSGQQFKNIERSSIELIISYSHLESRGGRAQPVTSWMFVKKDIDAAFNALVATENYVALKRAVVQPIIISGGTACVVTLLIIGCTTALFNAT